MIREAVSQTGAQLVALPELFAWRGPTEDEGSQAESIPGPTTEVFGELCRELRIHLVCGSVLEQSSGGARPFNTSVVIGPAGEVLGCYRKLHLFDVTLGDGRELSESRTRRPGNEAPRALELPWGKLGLSVCYDLRFPELYRSLAMQGARLFSVPSAFTSRTGRDHWVALLRARAIENLAFVLAPNQCGRNAEGVESYGRSVLIDPWGTALATVPDGEGWAAATLDLEAQERLRQSFPCLDHVRHDMFGLAGARREQ